LSGPRENFELGLLVILVAQNVPSFDLEIDLLDAVADSNFKVKLGG
jgi:hypothetical protein